MPSAGSIYMRKKFLKKGKTKLFILFLTLAVVSLSIFAPMASAADAPTGTWYNQSYNDWWLKVYDTSNPSEIFGERYTAAQVQWIIYSLFAFVTNTAVPVNADIMTCVMTNDQAKCAEALGKLVTKVPSVNNYAATQGPGIVEQIFSDRPLSGITYFKNLARKFSLIPEAKAQTGFGFQALDPVLTIWKATRDISYSLLIIVTIVFAFMIMFRVKLSPQTVITVQSALPKLAIAIILVTFSYAIAGLLIDLMYVVIGLGSLLFTRVLPATIATTPTALFNWLTKGQPTGINIGIGFGGIFFLYLVFFFLTLLLDLVMMVGSIVSGLIAVVAGLGLGLLITTPGINGFFFIIVGLIIIILAIIIMVMMFKIWWMLIKAFANIILLTIFAPLQIMIGTILPNFGFSNWLKSMVTNLSVFVVTGFLFLLSYVFLGFSLGTILDKMTLGGLKTALASLLFGTLGMNLNPPPAGWPPLLVTGGGAESIAFLMLAVSFVIFTIIPKTAQLVESLFAGKPFAYGSGIGEALGPAKAIGQTAAVGYTRLRPTGAATSLLKTLGIVK
jgi:hypothetical protein